MDYDKLDEILSTIDYKNKEYLSPIIDIIGQIKKCKCYIYGTNFNGLLFYIVLYVFKRLNCRENGLFTFNVEVSIHYKLSLSLFFLNLIRFICFKRALFWPRSKNT